MDFKKIEGHFRVDGPVAGSGGRDYPLTARSGGRSCKVAQYWIKVIAASSNATLGLGLEHGPDGNLFVLHSNVISLAAPASIPGLLVGDADDTKIIGEYLRPVVNIVSNDASVCWAVIEVYEMRKPF
jgi:hypothetical protein